MAASRYLVVVYVVTAGNHAEELGCDEEEIVLFTWLVVDKINSKVNTTYIPYSSSSSSSRASFPFT